MQQPDPHRHLPRTHAPVTLPYVPSAWQVARGAGEPKKPLLQVAVQLLPAVTFAAQVKLPPAGFSGAVLHTAGSNDGQDRCSEHL